MSEEDLIVEYRIEKDTIGEIKVPAHQLWAAQTQRSFENFDIGTEKMPQAIIQALLFSRKARLRLT